MVPNVQQREGENLGITNKKIYRSQNTLKKRINRDIIMG